jgi:hypothetical protein
MNDALDHDEHPVLVTMRQQIAATPMRATSSPLRASLLNGRPRLLAGASAGIAALSVTLVLIFAGASSPPAFAVTTNANGTITIMLNALSAVDALNAKLASSGVHVRVAPVVQGCNAPVQMTGSATPPATLLAQPGLGASRIQLSATANPEPSGQGLTNVPTGHMLVLAASHAGLQVVGPINQDTAPACVGLAS